MPGGAWASAQHLTGLKPTIELLRDIAKALDREPSDPAVGELFDQLVLRGHLAPFVPGWWELIRWCEVERVVREQ